MEVIKPDVKKAAAELKRGLVLVCPTDTVYGLICDANNKQAVERIYKIKKRPKNKLLPVFVEDIKMAKEFVKINAKQEKFLKKVWPGAVTVVIERDKSAIRVPKYQFIIDIIKEINRPLAETSANISGEGSTTKIKEILRCFRGLEDQPDLVLDAGDLKQAKPSQVIDLSGPEPIILRP